MSIIPFNFIPRSMFNMNQWFKPLDVAFPFPQNTLDMFDAFDELDNKVARNLEWINKPDFIKAFDFPTIPQKYRITLDTFGYDPKSIKTEYKAGKLIVTGREETKEETTGDFHVKEFKKTFELPVNAEPERLAVFMTMPGQLVIDVPLKETPTFKNCELYPQVTDKMDGGKEVWFNCTLPTGIDPTKVHVSVKDRDVIVKMDDIKKKPDGVSKMHYYKRSSLPPNTKFEDLKCVYDEDSNKLCIKAPLDMDFKKHLMHCNYPVESKWDALQGVNWLKENGGK
jgi:HSP20 family molecular chaperone IbpA